MMKKFTFSALVCILMGVFTAQAQFSESFDVAGTPAGWTVINLEGPATWEFGPLPEGPQVDPSNAGITPHSGAGVAYITWSQGHNDYLITPQFTVTAGASDFLRFYSRNWGTTLAGYNSDVFNVELSTTGTAAADFTVVLASNIIPPTQWTEYSYNLSEYEGQEVYIAIRAVTNGSKMRLYVDDVSVESLPNCPKPTALNATMVSDTEVDLSWTENGNSSNWEVVYGELGFDPNTEGTTIEVSGSSEYSLTGVTAEMEYDFYVRAICGPGFESEFSTKDSFYLGYCQFTAEYSGRYITDFSTEFGTENISNLSSGFSANGYGNFTDMTVNSYAGGLFDFDVVMNFQDAGMSYSIAIWIDFNEDFVFDESEQVFIDHYVHSASGTINIPQGITNGNYRMRVVAGQSYFPDPCTQNDDYAEAEDYTLTIMDPPTCLPVTDATASEVYPHSADLTWAFGYNESNWLVIYGEEGFDPQTEGIEASVSGGNSVTINDLEDNTGYDFYVIAVCSESDMSSMVGPTGFRTTCLSTTVPYSMDFEEAIIPNMPYCTSTQNIGFGTHEWETATQSSNGFNSTVLKYTYDPLNTADAWFFTQGIELEAGTNYLLTYKYGNTSVSFQETMKVSFGTSPQKTGMTTQLISHTSITGGQAQNGVLNFAVPTSGVYFFGFNAYSGANQLELLLDDIHIDEGSMCYAPTAIGVSDIDETTATVSWGLATTDVQNYKVTVYLEGDDPDTAPAVFAQTYFYGITEAVITGLDPNTNYDVYVTTICGGLASDVANPVAFTTDESVGVSNYDITNISYFPNPVKDQLTIRAATVIESVTVYNLLGAAVMQMGSKDTEILVDMSSLPAGAYILKASVAEGVSTFKVIKE